MKKWAMVWLAVALTACSTTQRMVATPMAIDTPTAAEVIDTPSAKVVVIRPAEQWTPVQAVLDNYDAGIRKKRYSLAVQGPDGKIQSDSPGWLKAAVDDMAEAGWKALAWLPKNANIIGPATTMTGKKL